MLHLLPGLIFSFILGGTAGNFATTFIHRLPKGENLFLLSDSMSIQKPYCSSCKAPLAVRDLFPILSWIMNKGKCRSCKAPIPRVYFVVEVACALLFTCCYLRFDFSEDYVLVAALGTLLVMLLAIEDLFQQVSKPILYLILAVGAVYRTYVDGSIFPVIGGGALGLAFGLLLWRMELFFGTAQSAIPLYVVLLGIGTAIAGPPSVMLLLALLMGTRIILSILRDKIKTPPANILLSVWTVFLAVVLFY